MKRKFSLIIRGSLKRNIFIAVALLIPSSILLVSSLTYSRYTDDLLDQSNTQVQQLIEQVAINTDTYIDELFRLCLSPYYNEDIMLQLQYTPTNQQEQLEKKRIIESYLREVMTIPRNDILRVYILSDDIYYSTKTAHSLIISDDFEDELWYKDAVSSDETVFIPVFSELSGGYSLSIFSVVQQLRSLKDASQVLGVIRVDANYAGIEKVCDKVSIMEHGALFIVDSANNIIYEHSNLPDTVLKDDVFSQVSDNLDSSVSTNISGERYFINALQINTTDWSIIAVNSYGDLTRNAIVTRNYVLLLSFISSVLGVAIAVLLVQRFLKPLYRTVKLMHQVQSGDLNVRADTHGTSEIAYLNQSFNEMLIRIQSMIKRDTRLTRQVYEARYLQKEAQYDALSNQIRPHFLFNTLNTISLLIKSKRKSEAVKSINELSVMLRGLINTDRDITLSAEFKIVESYLSLQKRRHVSLSYSIDLDPQYQAYILPALTIQPIAENAYIHGCETKVKDAVIQIYTQADEKYLIICIEDNGVGMDEDTLATLEKSLATGEYYAHNYKSHHQDEPQCSTPASRGIGLVNISKRIKLNFGDEYGLKISSKLNSGTIVAVLLPLERRS